VITSSNLAGIVSTSLVIEEEQTDSSQQSLLSPSGDRYNRPKTFISVNGLSTTAFQFLSGASLKSGVPKETCQVTLRSVVVTRCSIHIQREMLEGHALYIQYKFSCSLFGRKKWKYINMIGIRKENTSEGCGLLSNRDFLFHLG
jgi:hypothetical protein